MANNRLYIRDKTTGETFFLAKSNAPQGWRPVFTIGELAMWLDGRDLLAVEGDDTTALELTDDTTGGIGSS